MTPCESGLVLKPADCHGAPGVIQVQVQGRQADALLALSPEALKANFTRTISQFLGAAAISSVEEMIAFDFTKVPTLGGGQQACAGRPPSHCHRV